MERSKFTSRGGLDDQLLGGAVALSRAPEEIDVSYAKPAQGSLDPSWFVEGLSLGDLLGGLRRHRLVTMPSLDRGGTVRCGTWAAVAAADTAVVVSALALTVN